MTDPIHNVVSLLALPGGSDALLNQIRLAAISAGWLVDQHDALSNIGSQNGGHELFLRTQTTGFSEQGSFSLKSFLGQHADQTGLMVYANTGYSASLRVDNQQGMFARTNGLPVNAPSVAEVFAGLWDTGVNGDPADRGKYLTAPFPGAGATPYLASNTPHLNCPLSSNFDKVWIIYDQVASGGSRALTVLWYVGNQLYALCLGKVHYDSEGASPDNVDGTLLCAWRNKFDDRNTLLLPANNSLGGTRTSAVALDAPLAIIRNRTNGLVTWPLGTPDGTTLLNSGAVVKSNDHLEAGDGSVYSSVAMSVRPDMSFDSLVANLSDLHFPNPRLGVHRETFGTQHRIGVTRGRAISRWPDGGALGGIDGLGNGVVDWSDARYFLPWYYACTLGAVEGDIITNGSRQYIIFPGNRGGVDLFASHRRAGLAFRIA